MDETGQKKLNECLDYFRQRSVYEKLFQKFKEKYASLGHMGGKAVLSGLTLAEKQDLSGFLQKDYTENKTVTVSAGLLEKCLAESRFSGISRTSFSHIPTGSSSFPSSSPAKRRAACCIRQVF